MFAVAAVVAAVTVSGMVYAQNWTPTVPADAGTTLVASTSLQGDIAPDMTEGVDPYSVPRSPSGSECLARVERPAGWLDLCWQAYREPNDADPNQDYYRLRVYGSFGGDQGTGIRWVAIRARLTGRPSNNVFEGWPESIYDGPCGSVPQPAFVGAQTAETLCGRTAGVTDFTDWSHRATWTCVGCLIPDQATRSIALVESVAVVERTAPTWEIFADLGS